MADALQVKIYLLERVAATTLPDEWSRCVVAATTEKQAREMANQESKGEGFIWTDRDQVTAKELAPVANDGVDGGIIIFSRE